MRSKKEVEKLLMDNIETETLKRKWIRRYYVSLTEDHKQKCLYFIKLYGGNEAEL
ncbi:MAG: hypothetical protein PVJ67_04995 [Candidatus Pacearchaeota archaeon]|jgi:hypothetical protein